MLATFFDLVWRTLAVFARFAAKGSESCRARFFEVTDCQSAYVSTENRVDSTLEQPYFVVHLSSRDEELLDRKCERQVVF